MGTLVDRALRIAVASAAAPGAVRFTERQLYYELCRVLGPWHRAPRRPAFTVAPTVRYPDFRAALCRLGDVPGLLPAAAPPVPGAGRHTPEPDLFDYGLPRLLVCESHDIARMLRANGLPMESACPMFSAAELPLAPGVVEMLARAEGATVYLLHDASPWGLTFPQRLPGLTGLPDGTRVVPLGLRPRQAGSLHLTHGRATTRTVAPPSPTLRLAHAEQRWLERDRFAEVAAVRPASLLRTVHRLVRDVRTRRRPGGVRRARETGFLSWPTR
ncbi:hypothetical protein AQ490_11270 [Wenjunlia vitaminophila]|uniref:Uncharacterized protein n=1 Tax=Wenjunlia vitaminophila TaxID=76728 RepID=A0A0T6LK38_WENVI|nr:hypothetical protein [Wenjunlia vitaminophila]KRV46471.1 hypothetical protein AQ490_11270 [Wenjunlia vitaminophila]